MCVYNIFPLQQLHQQEIIFFLNSVNQKSFLKNVDTSIFIRKPFLSASTQEMRCLWKRCHFTESLRII